MTIGKIERLGLVIGPILILIELASWRFIRKSTLSKTFRPILIVVMVLPLRYRGFGSQRRWFRFEWPWAGTSTMSAE